MAPAPAPDLDRPGERHVLGIPGAAAEPDYLLGELAKGRLVARADLAAPGTWQLDPAGRDPVDPGIGERRDRLDPAWVHPLHARVRQRRG